MAESKELEIRHTKMNLYEIKFKGGGEVPRVLQGEFNNRQIPEQKIKTYLANRQKRGKSTRNKRVQ